MLDQYLYSTFWCTYWGGGLTILRVGDKFEGKLKNAETSEEPFIIISGLSDGVTPRSGVFEPAI